MNIGDDRGTSSRDGHEKSKLETETITSRDQDAGITSQNESEIKRSYFKTKLKQDVCGSQDVTETSKYTLSLLQ